MHSSQFILTTTGRLFDTLKLPRGASEYDFATSQWVVASNISGDEILNGRHISADRAAWMVEMRRAHSYSILKKGLL